MARILHLPRTALFGPHPMATPLPDTEEGESITIVIHDDYYTAFDRWIYRGLIAMGLVLLVAIVTTIACHLFTGR